MSIGILELVIIAAVVLVIGVVIYVAKGANR